MEWTSWDTFRHIVKLANSRTLSTLWECQPAGFYCLQEHSAVCGNLHFIHMKHIKCASQCLISYHLPDVYNALQTLSCHSTFFECILKNTFCKWDAEIFYFLINSVNFIPINIHIFEPQCSCRFITDNSISADFTSFVFLSVFRDIPLKNWNLKSD